jgi:hypothetical protein
MTQPEQAGCRDAPNVTVHEIRDRQLRVTTTRRQGIRGVHYEVSLSCSYRTAANEWYSCNSLALCDVLRLAKALIETHLEVTKLIESNHYADAASPSEG